MPLRQHTLPIVGIDYPNKRGPARRFELAICTPGEIVELRAEPTNPADPNAIAVFSIRGIQLGYLPAERALRIGALGRRGRKPTAIFQGSDQNRAYVRIAYDGLLPTLPEIDAPIRRVGENWSDEEWVDEFDL